MKASVRRLRADAVYLSVICLGELIRGVEKLPVGEKRQSLSAWLSILGTHFAERILGVDLEVARFWGEVTGSAQKQGGNLSIADGLIAATAMRHGLHLFTRNAKDFAKTGVRVVNPWVD